MNPGKHLFGLMTAAMLSSILIAQPAEAQIKKQMAAIPLKVSTDMIGLGNQCNTAIRDELQKNDGMMLL
ncbi:MAG: hypothetical protein WC889_05610, partial [Myxococcota bacterium]